VNKRNCRIEIYSNQVTIFLKCLYDCILYYNILEMIVCIWSNCWTTPIGKLARIEKKNQKWSDLEGNSRAKRGVGLNPNFPIGFPIGSITKRLYILYTPFPTPTPPHPTHLPLRTGGRRFFLRLDGCFGVFHSISLWEVALFLSER
jgi:hypothetical protein